MNVRFEMLGMENCSEILPQLFEILHENMTEIASTGYSYEADWLLWLGYITPRIETEDVCVLLMLVADRIAGYFQYRIEEGVLWVEEVEIKPEFQMTKLFYLFCCYLISWALPQICYIKSYVHKDNRKSILIHEHLAMERIGENGKGTSGLYCGDVVKMATCVRR